jgi:hypothetical protein
MIRHASSPGTSSLALTVFKSDQLLSFDGIELLVRDSRG